MSSTLLQILSGHIASANLMDGYDTRYYRWTDVDEEGDGEFILFRMAGPASLADKFVQAPDVRIIMVTQPTRLVEGDTRMNHIAQFLRGSTKPSGVVKIDVIGTVMGPMYLENGRGVFELNARCYVEDH